jgi:hypothetical protein
MKTLIELNQKLDQLRIDLEKANIDSDEAVNIYGEITDIEIKIDLLEENL